MHVPLKATRSIKRRTTSPQITPTFTPSETSGEIVENSPASSLPATSSYVTLTPSSIRSPIFKITDSDGAVSVTTVQEDDSGAISSESECIFSDPIGLKSPDLSPDRKVQFVVGSYIDDIPEDETKESDVSTPASINKLKKCKRRYF